jgi:hypothetical protein
MPAIYPKEVMDEKKREEKKKFAGKKKPSMKRRDDYNNYRGRKIYMITIEVEGRKPLFGTLKGDINAAPGSNHAPYIELTPLGNAVSKEWMGIPNHYQQIEVMGLQMMPDHLHGILYVREPLPVHLSQVITGFKTGCNRIFSALLGSAATKPQPTQNRPEGTFSSTCPVSMQAVASSQPPVSLPASSSTSSAASSTASSPASPSASPSASSPAFPSPPVSMQAVASSQPPASPSVSPSASSSAAPSHLVPLFAPNYNDLILKSYDELKRWKDYLADNPRRLMTKRAKPELLRPFFNLRIGSYTYNGIGNRLLLSAPRRVAVRVSRRVTGEQLDAEVSRYMSLARSGTVLVSPAISPGEKKVMRTAFDAGLPTIVVMANGFTPLSKPAGEQFYACAEGRLLMLSAWEHKNERRKLTAYLCQQMNLMALELSQSNNK